jgi:hypothetical protein
MPKHLVLMGPIPSLQEKPLARTAVLKGVLGVVGASHMHASMCYPKPLERGARAGESPVGDGTEVEPSIKTIGLEPVPPVLVQRNASSLQHL